MKIAVQLYTLRESLDADLDGTLARLSKLGMRFVELAGTYGLSDEEFQSKLSAHSLVPISTHLGIDVSLGDIPRSIELAKLYGYKFVIVPWVPESEYKDGWANFARKMSDALASYHEAGLHFGYHNHAFEFKKQTDGSDFFTFWQTASEDLIAEFDLYWLATGGQNPAEWIAKYPYQATHLHFKDRDKETGEIREVGKGDLDWPGIIKACQAASTQYAIIEHDEPKIDPVESVRISLEYLMSLGLKP